MGNVWNQIVIHHQQCFPAPCHHLCHYQFFFYKIAELRLKKKGSNEFLVSPFLLKLLHHVIINMYRNDKTLMINKEKKRSDKFVKL